MLRLKKWLADTKTTQVDLARAIKVSQPTVSDWINGNQFPSTEKLRRLSQFTGLSIDELLQVPAASSQASSPPADSRTA